MPPRHELHGAGPQSTLDRLDVFVLLPKAGTAAPSSMARSR